MFASMRVLVFASQKGGSGKSTLAGHIAVEAAREESGAVAVIDTDPQASLAKWWNARRAPEPALIQSVYSNLLHDLDRARADGFRLVVIDTPPSVTHAISQVVSFADLVVAPTRPSPHDIRAVGPTIDIAESHAKPLIFVLNGANPQARITAEAAIALSQHGTVSPATIHNRVDFAASMIDGRTVMEIDPVCHSAREIGQTWAYLKKRLDRMDASAQAQAGAPAHLAISGARPFGRRSAAFV